MHNDDYGSTDAGWADDQRRDEEASASDGASFGEKPDPFQRRPSGCGCSPLVVIGLVFGAVLIFVCCGGGYLLLDVRTEAISDEIRPQIQNNDKFREHIGDAESFEMNWNKSFDAEAAFYFDVKGPNGEGQVKVWTEDQADDTMKVVKAELRLKSGEIVDLEINADNDDDSDIAPNP